MRDHSTLTLAMDLLARRSITPNDDSCQQLLIDRLEPLGFVAERLRFGEVDNLWLRRGFEPPLFVFAGHTDVVPPGDESVWQHPPFEPAVIDGYLCGRGAADMKGSIAAMVTAIEAFVEAHPNHRGSIALLITSDEEGEAVNGTRKVVEHLQARKEHIEWCLVGEPSSTEMVGDVIKVGRRGSLTGFITVHGVQGHVAYPHLASNPVHLLAPALHELTKTQWDQGNEHFPPTSFQVWELSSGGTAANVIPGKAQLNINFRYSSELTADEIKARVEAILRRHDVTYDIRWWLSGEPFLTSQGELVEAVRQTILQQLGQTPELSTSGGTSDGRFIAPMGAQVVELGPCNATIHKMDERVKIADLHTLSALYQGILTRLLTTQEPT